MKQYTCFCATPAERRGYYSEEIDVEAKGPTEAKRKAEEMIADGGYEKDLKVRRVVWIRVPQVQVFSSE